MAKTEMSLFHLAASIEEILDASLEDARSRAKYRRQMVEQLHEMEERITKHISSLSLSAKATAQIEGLILSPTTLGKWGQSFIRWILPISIGAYEAISHALPHLKP